MSTVCIGCGRGIPTERAALGYTYCTAPDCQARYRQGPTVTAVAVNKSADAYRVVDRTAAGETREDAGDDRVDVPRVPAPRRAPRRVARPATPSWTPAQENIVRLYADMGLSPRQIVERARRNTPRLAVTEALAVRILSSPRR
ncbi:hypothetical protein [Actinomycetospora aeridis]|uniref:Uncharacterized protein n=1 Tax=Actinomycetospora aeridis TaxID=3129231 RepID=A0ABU8MZV9_9PSEU